MEQKTQIEQKTLPEQANCEVPLSAEDQVNGQVVGQETDQSQTSPDQSQEASPDGHTPLSDPSGNEDRSVNEEDESQVPIGDHTGDQNNANGDEARKLNDSIVVIDDAVPESPQKQRICIPQCKLNVKNFGKKKVKFLQCCLCQVWFHIQCVDLTPKQVKDIGFWPCPKCRLLVQNIDNIQCTLKRLTEMVQNLSKNKISEHPSQDECVRCCQLEEQLNLKQTQYEELQANFVHSKHHNNKMSDHESSCDSDSDESSDCEMLNDESDLDHSDVPEPSGHMIIGDSLIKNIEPVEDNVYVACMRGAKVHDACKRLKQEKRRFESITIVCGTNNLSKKMNVEKTTEQTQLLLMIAKKCSKHVILSSIPPRLDNTVTDQSLQNLNERFQYLASKNGVKFVNHDENFRFLNEIPDEGLLTVDGLHLSASGVQRLIANLGLKSYVKNNLKQATEFFKEKTQSQNNTEKPRRKICTKSRNGVTVFFGKDSLFSNLNTSTPITIDGHRYNCNEQYYTHELANFFGDKETARKALLTEDPYELVALHKNIANYDQRKWVPVGERVLLRANLAKFSQNSAAQKALLDTQSDIIGEASYSRQWGIGIPIQSMNVFDHRHWTGKNIMGNILMNVRKTLMNIDNENTRHERQYRHNERQSCWFCGERNHISKNCRHGQKIQCTVCFEYGHKAKFCNYAE